MSKTIVSIIFSLLSMVTLANSAGKLPGYCSEYLNLSKGSSNKDQVYLRCGAHENGGGFDISGKDILGFIKNYSNINDFKNKPNIRKYKNQLINNSAKNILRARNAYLGLFKVHPQRGSIYKAKGCAHSTSKKNPGLSKELIQSDQTAKKFIDGLSPELKKARKKEFMRKELFQALVNNHFFQEQEKLKVAEQEKIDVRNKTLRKKIDKVNGKEESTKRIKITETCMKEGIKKAFADKIKKDPSARRLGSIAVSKIRKGCLNRNIGYDSPEEKAFRIEREKIKKAEEDAQKKLRIQMQPLYVNMKANPILFHREDDINFFSKSTSKLTPSKLAKKFNEVEGADEVAAMLKKIMVAKPLDHGLILKKLMDPKETAEIDFGQGKINPTEFRALFSNIEKKVSDNTEIQELAGKGVANVVEGFERSIYNICDNDGDKLHHFPLLTNHLLNKTNRSNSSNKAKKEIMELQSAQCWLMANNPLDMQGNKIVRSFGLGFLYLGTGIQVVGLGVAASPGSLAAGPIIGFGAGVAAAGGGILTYQSHHLNKDAQKKLDATLAVHAGGWAKYDSVIQAAENKSNKQVKHYYNIGALALEATGIGVARYAKAVKKTAVATKEPGTALVPVRPNAVAVIKPTTAAKKTGTALVPVRPNAAAVIKPTTAAKKTGTALVPVRPNAVAVIKPVTAAKKTGTALVPVRPNAVAVIKPTTAAKKTGTALVPVRPNAVAVIKPTTAAKKTGTALVPVRPNAVAVIKPVTTVKKTGTALVPVKPSVVTKVEGANTGLSINVRGSGRFSNVMRASVVKVKKAPVIKGITNKAKIDAVISKTYKNYAQSRKVPSVVPKNTQPRMKESLKKHFRGISGALNDKIGDTGRALSGAADRIIEKRIMRNFERNLSEASGSVISGAGSRSRGKSAIKDRLNNAINKGLERASQLGRKANEYSINRYLDRGMREIIAKDLPGKTGRSLNKPRSVTSGRQSNGVVESFTIIDKSKKAGMLARAKSRVSGLVGKRKDQIVKTYRNYAASRKTGRNNKGVVEEFVIMDGSKKIGRVVSGAKKAPGFVGRRKDKIVNTYRNYAASRKGARVARSNAAAKAKAKAKNTTFRRRASRSLTNLYGNNRAPRGMREAAKKKAEAKIKASRYRRSQAKAKEVIARNTTSKPGALARHGGAILNGKDRVGRIYKQYAESRKFRKIVKQAAKKSKEAAKNKARKAKRAARVASIKSKVSGFAGRSKNRIADEYRIYMAAKEIGKIARKNVGGKYPNALARGGKIIKEKVKKGKTGGNAVKPSGNARRGGRLRAIAKSPKTIQAAAAAARVTYLNEEDGTSSKVGSISLNATKKKPYRPGSGYPELEGGGLHPNKKINAVLKAALINQPTKKPSSQPFPIDNRNNKADASIDIPGSAFKKSDERVRPECANEKTATDSTSDVEAECTTEEIKAAKEEVEKEEAEKNKKDPKNEEDPAAAQGPVNAGWLPGNPPPIGHPVAPNFMAVPQMPVSITPPLY